MQRKTFWRVVKTLRMHYPKYKVSIRFCKISTMNGWCRKDGANRFTIKISNDLDENHAIDVLIHEFAHCISWNLGTVHGPEWGKAFARVYRIVEKNHLN